MPKYSLVLLDADNTLLDFDKAERIAILTTLEHFSMGATEEHAQLYSKINDGLWQQFNRGEISQPALQYERFNRLTRQLGCNTDPHEVDMFYRVRLGQGAYLLPGAEEFCLKLMPHCRLALLTNGTAETQHSRFSRCPLTPLFDGRIFISGEIGFQKPSCDYFNYVLEKLGVSDLSSAVIVGDSLSSDIQGGLNMGIDTIWFNLHDKQPDPNIPSTYTVRSLSEAAEIILG